MKRLLCGFIVGYLVADIVGVKAQEVPAEQFHLTADAIAAVPKVDLTLARLIEVFADYALSQEISPLMDHVGYYGLTDFKNRTIYLNNRADRATKQETLIHELIHVLYWNVGYMTTGPIWEHRVSTEASQMYSQLYGTPK